jgi:hypothetical protein
MPVAISRPSPSTEARAAAETAAEESTRSGRREPGRFHYFRSRLPITTGALGSLGDSGFCWACCNHSNLFVLWSPLSWQIWRFYLLLNCSLVWGGGGHQILNPSSYPVDDNSTLVMEYSCSSNQCIQSISEWLTISNKILTREQQLKHMKRKIICWFVEHSIIQQLHAVNLFIFPHPTQKHKDSHI